MDLDPTDVAILRALQVDSRRSLREIARSIGVSTPTVSARLTALERLGIVTGYTALLDPDRLDETSVALVVTARLPATEKVAAALAAFPWSRRVTIARGGRILVDATLVDPSEVDGLLESVARTPGVVDAEHFVALRTVKEGPRALVPDRATATPLCFECKGPIAGTPVRRRIDGRDHFFCCRSCESLYVRRYEAVKARAAKGSRRR